MTATIYKRHMLGMIASLPAVGCGVAHPQPAWNGLAAVATPSQIEWRGVCWSPDLELFVAVAQDEGDGPAVGHANLVMTSPDGENWTVREAAAQLRYQDVCWSPDLELFVAVAQDGTVDNAVMTSPNGVDWTNRTIPRTNGWRTVIWSSAIQKFVALAQTGDSYRVMTSSNGTEWTAFECPFGRWRNLVYAPSLGRFIAVGERRLNEMEDEPDYYAMTSTDGEAWEGQIAPAQSWQGVDWSETLGIAVAVCEATSGRRVMVTRDGFNWDLRDHATDTSFRSVGWSPELGVFLAVGNNADTEAGETAAMTSYDGHDWHALKTAAGLSLGKCAYSPSLERFACVGQVGWSRVQIGPFCG